jgi:transmembrane sensor
VSEASHIASPSARELRAEAAIWLERRDCDEWSLKDQEALDVWLARSPGHMVAYLRAEAAWRRADRLSAFGPATQEAPAPQRLFTPLLLKLAAAFGLIAMLGIGATAMFARPHERMFSTPIGGRETINFADGSQIELNTNTVLRARMTTEERVVWLDKGEAFFRIKHDAAHPFVVMVGDHRVTDLGTKFTVRRESGKMEVAVVEGRVTFDRPDAPARSQVALLMPGDIATATPRGMRIVRATEKELSNDLAWRRGLLVFDKTTLASAAAQFNRYNRIKLVIADSYAAKVTIDGTFQAGNIGDFTRLVQTVLGLRVAIHGDEAVISR